MKKGDLPIDISWWVKDEFDNERRLLTNDGIVISKTTSRTSMLSIESVQGRHRGLYKCVAKNNAGLTEFSAELKINGD